MVDHKTLPNDAKVGGLIFEELAFEYFAKNYSISKPDLLKFITDKKNTKNINIDEDKQNTFPLSILHTVKLSSLEAIVKFLRENRSTSYAVIGILLNRNPKTLAVTYVKARRKMPEFFSEEFDEDTRRIPFTVFSDKLSVLECVCSYLKSEGYSYVEISRMIGKDQRTIWTVCKRAEKKSGNILGKKSSKVYKSLSKNPGFEKFTFEELVYEHFSKKYGVSKKDLLSIAEEKQKIINSIPLSILATSRLSSLEAIVKFLRENIGASYALIGKQLRRNARTLAATYAVARRKMPEFFSKEFDEDTRRIPFTVFSDKLSVLECVCSYLKSEGYSYAQISRMINKDQRTVWTVCHRAELKLKGELKREDNDRQ